MNNPMRVMQKKIKLALITKAETVSGNVAIFFKKMSTCKFFGMTPKEYDETKISDLRKMNAWVEIMNMRGNK